MTRLVLNFILFVLGFLVASLTYAFGSSVDSSRSNGRANEVWFDLKHQIRSVADLKNSPDILVMGDLPAEQEAGQVDYFATLQFDSDGYVIEGKQTSIDELLDNPQFFSQTLNQADSEYAISRSADLLSEGRGDRAMGLLDKVDATVTEQRAKLSYQKVQNLTVRLRSKLDREERQKLTKQLGEEIKRLTSYGSKLSDDDKELVNDLLFHAEVQVAESEKELKNFNELSRPAAPASVSDISSNSPSMTVRSSVETSLSDFSSQNSGSRPQTSKDAPISQPAPSSKSRLSDRNPIMKLSIRGPQDISRAEAETILKGIGLMTGKRGFQESLQGLYKGSTYKSNPNAKLDSQMKGFLFNEYRLMRKALEKYSHLPVISQQATPQLYDQWMQKASMELTALGSQRERYALLKSLMTQESGRTHWRNFVPVMGYTADIGFGQFLPATAKSVGINPYDPEENMRGIAKYLNNLIKSKGMRNGLASYNGGNYPPPKSFRYADSIMSRIG